MLLVNMVLHIVLYGDKDCHWPFIGVLQVQNVYSSAGSSLNGGIHTSFILNMNMCTKWVYFHEQSLWCLNLEPVISFNYCVLHIYSEPFTHCDLETVEVMTYLSLNKFFHLKLWM